MGPRLHLSFFSFKTACLTPELLVCMCPSTHLWHLHAKQRLLDQNYKSLEVPALICVFAFKTATLGPELQVSVGPRLHLWFFAFKTASLAPELQVSKGPSPHQWFCEFTTETL